MKQLRDIRIEAGLLSNWKVKLALLTAIVSPAVTGTAAYYNFKAEVKDAIEATKEQAEQKYVRREAFQDLKDNVKDTRDDVRDIKKILLQRSR